MILTELHDHGRIALQLVGRCGRRSDVRVLLCLEYRPSFSKLARVRALMGFVFRLLLRRAVHLSIRALQYWQPWRAEAAHRRLQKDDRDRPLALSGALT